jgi:hypothetical protein
MDIATHVIFIPLIIFFLFMLYLAWFKDLAKSHWERKNAIPFLPPDLVSYRQAFKVLITISFLTLITLYILILTGVIVK